MHSRRGVILPAVLFILLLLGLLGARFAFRVNADLASMQAVAYRLQTRLAAEAGIEMVKGLLRQSRFDVNRWYQNPKELHRVVVWGYGMDPKTLGTNNEIQEGGMVYRFSIVADDPLNDDKFIRIGITDESSKLNLNTATPDQLLVLVTAAVADNQSLDPKEIVNGIIDWRDEDSKPRTQKADTEGDYYRQLDKPYLVKNGPFDTVEELLLVKDVSGQLLYGEDFDRNGLLTGNEDDGDASFPPDNEDGILNRGLYPYLTTLSTENNVSNDNRPRIYLLGPEAEVRPALELEFPNDPNIVDYIISATSGSAAQGGGGSNNSSGDSTGQDGADNNTGSGGSTPRSGSDDGAGADNAGNGGRTGSNKINARSQVADPSPEKDNQQEEDQSGSSSDDSQSDLQNEQDNEDSEGNSDDGTSGPAPIPTPVSLLRSRVVIAGGELSASPLTMDQLPILLDRTTMQPTDQPARGLINVNTAPALVLRTLKELTEEQVIAIIMARDSLDSKTKETPAWLLTEGVLDLDTMERVMPRITARGQQFTIESLGYADHVGTVYRLQAVVDVAGPVLQTVYYRNLTELGGQFPIREKDLRSVRR